MNNFLKYKSPIIYSTVKKIQPIARYLYKKCKTFSNITKFLYILNKKYSKTLLKFIYCAIDCIEKATNKPKEEIMNMTVNFIILNATKKYHRALRRKNKGRYTIKKIKYTTLTLYVLSK